MEEHQNLFDLLYTQKTVNLKSWILDKHDNKWSVTHANFGDNRSRDRD